jgi:hypothetical protein
VCGDIGVGGVEWERDRDREWEVLMVGWGREREGVVGLAGLVVGVVWSWCAGGSVDGKVIGLMEPDRPPSSLNSDGKTSSDE